MKTIRVSTFLAIALLLWACPYSSPVPIDKPSIKTEKNFIGKWVKADDLNSENPDFFEFSKLDKFRYKVVEHTYSTTDSTYTQANFTMHFSKIDDLTFINMLKDGESNYYLYKINPINDTEFILTEITDNIDEKFTKSEELKAFIKRNMNLSFFYNNDDNKYIKQ